MAEGSKEEKLPEEEGMAVLDFDMLCANVALQTQGGAMESRRREEELEGNGGEFGGGIQRLWEGEVLDCFEDRRIAIESSWYGTQVQFFYLFVCFCSQI